MSDSILSAHETIIVGVDTSEESIVALRWAARLASHTGAKLLAVHAEGLLEEGAFVPRVDVADVVSTTLAGEPLLASTSSLVEPGHPADTLLRVAQRTKARHIVVGHRGVGATQSDIGSTALALVNRSTIPVTVVRAPL
ncbi:MAG TPA: universal stress protein [Ilumatobacteraceae bacterium]|jgi:nucleotide-binding universal stress UspA family protein